MKRTLIGALLFLILVGEPTVGRTSGLFTPAGIIIFAVLYISYFLLFDSLVHRYKLNNLQMVLMNFALYSVLITGLLHGEIRDYVLHPHNNLITTLIRIQCSVVPLYAYPLLAKLAPHTRAALKLLPSLLVFIAAMLVLSLSKHFGIADLLDTFNVAPVAALFLVVCAAGAILVALNSKKSQHYKTNTTLEIWSWIFLLIGLVPSLPFFLILLVGMILASWYFLTGKYYRRISYADTV